MRCLQYVSDAAVQPQKRTLPGVAPVDQYPPPRRLVEPADEIDQCRLARSCLADDGDISPLRHLEAEVFQNILLPVRVAEVHMIKLDVSMNRLPVFLLRMKDVAVPCKNLRAVCHIRLLLHQPGEPLDVDLNSDQVTDGDNDLLNRVDHRERIAHEDGKRPDPDDSIHRDLAALPENQSQRCRSHQRHERDEHRTEVSGSDRHATHLLGILLEILLHPLLNHERLDAPRPCNPLVEVPGDARIQLPDLPVQNNQFLLEEPDQKEINRNQNQQPEKQPPVDDEHQDHHKDQVGPIPHQVHQPPGRHFPDLARIAHHARVDIPDIVLVEVREGQLLQVLK